MFKSLRYRVLLWLLAFVFSTASFIIPLNYFINQKKDKINTVVNELNSLQIKLLKLFQNSDNFLFAETVNPVFFITGESKYLTERQIISENIRKKASSIKKLSTSQSFLLGKEIDSITGEFERYNMIFDSLVLLVYKKGYRNFGLEGEMIDYVNQLERNPRIDEVLFLQIRRNEKDYFLRKENYYYDNFERLIAGLLKKVQRDRSFSKAEKQNTIDLINDYRSVFASLINIDKIIGLTDNSGLRFKLNQQTDNIENLLSDLHGKARLNQRNLLKELNIYYAVFMIIALIISIIISFIISKYILSHLEKLTRYISQITEHNFNYSEKLDLKKSASEITHIYKEFRNMLSQLRVWEKQTDKALKNAEENEKRYRELADMLPQSIYETDELGNFTYVNKAWYRHFGYSKEDLSQGLNLIETVISESSDDILGNNRLENSNFVAIRKDGSRFPASVYSDNIIIDSKIAGKRGIIIDATQNNIYIHSLKKETYKAQTSDRLKSSFIANMSHEIRTPMNSIIGFSNLLASDEISESQKKEFINYIHTSGEMLLNLIDDIIDIAKIEAGELKINKKEMNVDALFSELHNTFNTTKNKSGKSHINLLVTKDAEQNLSFKTDPFRLRQVMINLIGNAIKFTDNGSVEFGYRLKNEKEIEFFVKDTGIGLTKEELGIVFERFKRTYDSEEKNIVGSGLGLAISKNLVELMGGEMWLDSKPGIGTTFYFTLPYIKTIKILQSTVIEESINSYNWHNKTILIVEDDKQSYYFLQELLKRTGGIIRRASNGFEAIDICRNDKSLDIVLMDIQLPKMNGYDATREIKKIRKDLPVIAQTAYAMAGDREKSIEAGCNDYITKPLNIETLLPKINQFLNITSKKTAESSEEGKNLLSSFIKD
jgi:PAS domain S-box-containing protein